MLTSVDISVTQHVDVKKCFVNILLITLRIAPLTGIIES